MDLGNSLRERLIDVGVDLVMTDGTASLGLREIARHAGVSHGAPRRYFPTRHALLSAIARRGFADLGSRFEAAADEDASPRDRLETLARTYLRYAGEHRGMFELMFRHDLLNSEKQPSEHPPLREATLPLFAHLVDLVTRHAAERPAAVSSAPPAVVAAALWSNLHGAAQLWAWGSLQLVLGAAPLETSAADDPLLAAVLDAHLGPVSE
ncbi:TetR/AcrR family transcriptional regulator [Streptomyces sp. NPDC001743]|uniref:TetR/AcrR family transcriptional regulator n=1 Tax=Streptomyces sp. NPDC001743 TaxID=3154397 RepID=UPI00331E7B6B